MADLKEHHIANKFEQIFGKKPEVCAYAPGRINLIGEHTDYNQGWVFPAAIAQRSSFALRKRVDLKINLIAQDLRDTTTFTLDGIKKDGPAWSHYHKGILQQLQQRYTLTGFDCVFSSTVPLGAGVSSSSAIECGFLAALNQAYNLQLDLWEMVFISQKSNHTFLGVQGGFLDQFSSFFGKKDFGMVLDCHTRTYEYIPVTLPNHHWILINTNIKHDHTTSDYNLGPEECKEALYILQGKGMNIQNLSQLTHADLPKINSNLPINLINRVTFIINENQRVHDFKTALLHQDLDTLGRLMSDSHHGLAKQYRVSCEQLDFLVMAALSQGFVGARMMGGGFGGCTLNLVKSSKDMYKKFEYIHQAYHQTFGLAPTFIEVVPSHGVEVISIEDV